VSLEDWANAGILERETRIYQEMLQQGIHTTFITYGNASDRQWQSSISGINLVPIYERLSQPRNRGLALLQSLLIPWKFRKEIQVADLFKTNQIWGGWVAAIAKQVWRKPLLVRCGYDAYTFATLGGAKSLKLKLLKLISSYIYRSGTHIFVASARDRDNVENVFGVSGKKITLHENWVDTDVFTPMSTVGEKSGQLLVVGRLNKQKNIALLVEALSGSDYGLDIIGSGEEKASLSSLAKKLNVKLQFLGVIPNQQLERYYQRYLIYVICSKYEGNPKSLIEAMSCGLAVIGTRVQGIVELITDEHNGLVCREDATSLRVAIDRLVADSDLCASLGSQARSFILSRNSLTAYLERELKVYGQITKMDYRR